MTDGPPLPYEERRRRLRAIATGWRDRLAALESSAVAYFQERNLDEISRLLVEKRRIERSLTALESFLAQYLS